MQIIIKRIEFYNFTIILAIESSTNGNCIQSFNTKETRWLRPFLDYTDPL